MRSWRLIEFVFPRVVYLESKLNKSRIKFIKNKDEFFSFLEMFFVVRTFLSLHSRRAYLSRSYENGKFFYQFFPPSTIFADWHTNWAKISSSSIRNSRRLTLPTAGVVGSTVHLRQSSHTPSVSTCSYSRQSDHNKCDFVVVAYRVVALLSRCALESRACDIAAHYSSRISSCGDSEEENLFILFYFFLFSFVAMVGSMTRAVGRVSCVAG